MPNIVEVPCARSDLEIGRVYGFRDRISGIIAGGMITEGRPGDDGQTIYTVEMSARGFDMNTGRKREFELRETHG